MKCSNCNCEISSDSKFCTNCGKQIESINGTNPVINNNVIQNVNNGQVLPYTKLSIISLICLIIQPLAASSILLSEKLAFLSMIPWTIISTVLAIVSKCKYNDKMSKVLIIINCVLFGLGIILIIVGMFIFAALIEEIAQGC